MGQMTTPFATTFTWGISLEVLQRHSSLEGDMSAKDNIANGAKSTLDF
jgi:hypothetical protein